MIVLSAMIVVGIVVFGSFGAARGQQTDGRTAPAPLIGDLETVATPAMLVALEPAQATEMAVSGVSPQTTEQRIIGNTGGIGVRFRVEPFQEAPSPQDLPDGALVYLLDNSTDTTGTIWWRVALASGDVGFVKERYLREP